MKISFVVAVYNTAAYIEKCLQSLINQTMKEIEIIVVNDGSTDNSLEIIKKYAKEDSRIIIIDKANGGLSDARNTGINIAKGEYVALVDGDDWVDIELADKVYNKLKQTNSDMCIFGIRYLFLDGKEINRNFYPRESKVLSNIETLDLLFNSEGFKCHAVNKICKRDIAVKYKYPLGKVFEDVATTYKLIYECKRVCFLEEKLYNYLQGRSDSILGSNFNEKKLYIIDILGEIKQFIYDNNLNFKLDNSFKCFYYDNLISLISMYSLSNEDNYDVYEKLRGIVDEFKAIEILKCRINFKAKIKLIFVKINMNMYISVFRRLKLFRIKHIK